MNFEHRCSPADGSLVGKQMSIKAMASGGNFNALQMPFNNPSNLQRPISIQGQRKTVRNKVNGFPLN